MYAKVIKFRQRTQVLTLFTKKAERLYVSYLQNYPIRVNTKSESTQ